jgi:hypothetical protein
VIDSGTLARLVALGRQKGQVTNQDLEEALPIDAMSAEDIALVVVHLEEAGVSVDLDENLLAQASPSAPLQSNPAAILLAANDPGSPPPIRSDTTLSVSEVPPSQDDATVKRQGGFGAHTAITVAIILILLLGVVALALGS